MKIINLSFIAVLASIAIISHSEAQIRRPAPTGQIPSGRVQTGQGSANPYSQYQPKPTGQIAPAVIVPAPGQSPANAGQAPVTQNQVLNPTQPGQVQKVTESQVQTTQTGEFAPNQVLETERVITTEQTQANPVQQVQPGNQGQLVPQTNAVNPARQNNTVPEQRYSTQPQNVTRPGTSVQPRNPNSPTPPAAQKIQP